MKRWLFLAIFLLTAPSVFAQPMRVGLQDGSGNAFGTASNPIKVECLDGCGEDVSDMWSTWTDPIVDHHASGSIATTTGTISSGSNSLSVASASGWEVGMGIAVANAGTGGNTELITSVTAINGTTFTLANNASATATGQTVRHDDTVALQAAFDSAKNVHLRAGNYNVTGLLTLNVSKMVIGDGPVGRGNTSTGDALTSIFQNSTTTGTIKITKGYSILRDFSIQMASGKTPTAGYGIEVASTASTNDRFYDIANMVIYGTFGGLKIGTAISHGHFRNLQISVASASTEAAIYYNNPSPAGDNFFTDIICLTILSGTPGAKGIHIVAGDVTGWTNVKTLNFDNDLLIDASVSSVNFQKFANCSFENNTSTNSVVKITSSSVGNISFIGSEIGTNSTGVGIEIASGAKNILIAGNNFSTLTTGISLTSNGGGTSIIGNSFKTVTTAISLGSSAKDYAIYGNVYDSVTTQINGNLLTTYKSMIHNSADTGGYAIISGAADGVASGGFVTVAQDSGAATTSGARLGGITAAGARDSSHSLSAGGGLIFFANGTFSPTSLPTNAQLQLAPSGSTTRTAVQTWLSTGNVGIGTTNPVKSFEVKGGDAYINNTSGQLILKSPDGTCSSCGVDNSDAWSCTGVACP